MTYPAQLEAILVAQSECAADPEGGDVHVFGMPEDPALLRLGNARLCDSAPLGGSEVVYHVRAMRVGEHNYCDSCGYSDFPEA